MFRGISPPPAMPDVPEARSHARWITTLAVSILLALAAGGATWWVQQQGYTQYYGDAQAHLNIARRVLDSQTPGMLQIGTVWLPLPHLLMMPLAGDDALWSNGLAGAIPVSVCFWLAGLFLFLSARRWLGSSWAAFAAVAVFALNPNALYLQAAPMTEAIFFAALSGILYGCLRFVASPGLGWATFIALFAMAGALTRYDGWFLLPFVAAFLVWKGASVRWTAALLFCLIAGAAPLWWVAHNWWFWGDPLEFYHGPYSAKAIYARQLATGMAAYPGDHNYWESARYLLSATRLSVGWPLLVFGFLGALAILTRAHRWPLLLLVLPAAFYLQSMHNGGTPIFVPDLWPHAHYNIRYGMTLFPLLCVGVAVLVRLAPRRFAAVTALLVIAGCVAPWLLAPVPESWAIWKESEVNGRQRRVWLAEGSAYLQRFYQPGEGILLSFGDATGVLQLAGIPLRESIHEGNHPMFRAAVNKPEYFLWVEWAVCQAGDEVSRGMQRAVARGMPYGKAREIRVGNAAPLEIWRRQSEFLETDMTLPRRMLPTPLPIDTGDDENEDWEDEGF